MTLMMVLATHEKKPTSRVEQVNNEEQLFFAQSDGNGNGMYLQKNSCILSILVPTPMYSMIGGVAGRGKS